MDIGDELRDLDAAEAAGMPFGAVTWGWADGPAFAQRQARVLFASVREMEDYLLTMEYRSDIARAPA